MSRTKLKILECGYYLYSIVDTRGLVHGCQDSYLGMWECGGIHKMKKLDVQDK